MLPLKRHSLEIFLDHLVQFGTTSLIELSAAKKMIQCFASHAVIFLFHLETGRTRLSKEEKT